MEWSNFTGALPLILKGVPLTLSLTGISFTFGIVIGLIIAIIRVYKVPVLNQIFGVYISFIRGTPLLIQIFLIYIAIPSLFKSVDMKMFFSSISTFIYLCIVFSINISAYLAETFRSGIISVPKGQIEAARAMNMPEKSIFLYIIFPQAIAISIPSIGNLLLIQLKNTSLAFFIGAVEIIGSARIVIARTSRSFEPYIIAALVYWVICIVLEKILKLIERHFTKHFRNTP